MAKVNLADAKAMSAAFFRKLLQYSVYAKDPEKAAKAGALVLVREIKSELLNPGLGRWYGQHRASRPGDPPAPDSNVLNLTIGYEIIRDRNIVRVGSGVEYSSYLEYGTRKMEPRPFMRTAFFRASKIMTVAVIGDLKTKRPPQTEAQALAEFDAVFFPDGFKE